MSSTAPARWSIPIEEIVRQTNAKVENVARAITFQLFRAVALRSPVDTGRFRANWHVAFGKPNYSTSDETSANLALFEASKALTLPVGGIVWMSNGLPYAVPLENGHSGQAPRGMVRITVAEISQHIQEGLRKGKAMPT